ncbi:MAG: hypothetical protein ACYSP9_08880 [Planctomycetota bacterium]
MRRELDVQCELCPKMCIMKPGQSGECRVRINIDGVLQTVVYGFPCSLSLYDPVEKNRGMQPSLPELPELGYIADQSGRQQSGLFATRNTCEIRKKESLFVNSIYL